MFESTDCTPAPLELAEDAWEMEQEFSATGFGISFSDYRKRTSEIDWKCDQREP